VPATVFTAPPQRARSRRGWSLWRLEAIF